MQGAADPDGGLRYKSRSSSSPHWVGGEVVRGGGSDSGESTSGRSIPSFLLASLPLLTEARILPSGPP